MSADSSAFLCLSLFMHTRLSGVWEQSVLLHSLRVPELPSRSLPERSSSPLLFPLPLPHTTWDVILNKEVFIQGLLLCRAELLFGGLVPGYTTSSSCSSPREKLSDVKASSETFIVCDTVLQSTFHIYEGFWSFKGQELFYQIVL